LQLLLIGVDYSFEKFFSSCLGEFLSANEARHFKLLLAGEPHTSNPSRCHRDTSTESISWTPSSDAMTVRDQAQNSGHLGG